MKESVSVPVLANGDIKTSADITAVVANTGVDGETVFVLRVRLMFVVQVSCVLEEYYKIQPCLLATVQLLSNVSKTG